MQQENNEKKPGGVTGKGFVKGDPRINRKGRPKAMDALRKLTVDMLIQPAADANGQPIILNGKRATNIEIIIFQCIHSKDWRRLEYVLNVAYGKVPDQHQIAGKDGEDVKIVVNLKGEND